MTSQEASCPDCGHSPLNHKKGGCMVIVTIPLPQGSRGEQCKRHCACQHYVNQLGLTFGGTDDSD